MKKHCINCQHATTALVDKEYESIFEMVTDSENDYLVCIKTCEKTDDDFTCKEFEMYKI